MFQQQKPYALFFRTENASEETPPESRIYKCDNSSEGIRGTKKQIREQIQECIPIFISKIKINEIPENLLPIKGVR